MSLKRDQVCVYCAAIIQGNAQGLGLRSEVSIEILRTSSEFCVICRVLLASNIKSSQRISEKRQGQIEDLETLPIRVEMGHVQSSHSGLMWATVTTFLFHKSSGFSYPNIFIFQVCSVNGVYILPKREREKISFL